MNPLGVHSHLFRGPPASVAERCRQLGLGCVQLTPSFPGLSFHEPGQVTAGRCREASEPFLDAGLTIAALSAYTNLMDPDLDRRHRGIVRLHALIRHCRDFGASFLVTETGSLGPRSPWAPYPPNRSPEAWDELRFILREALRVAADSGVRLLLKAEPTHVLASAPDALQLRKELAHPALGFVMDPAHFLSESPRAGWSAELADLFEQLGRWAPILHAKDLRFQAGRVRTPRAGQGELDYGQILRLFRRMQPDAPIIVEHLRPEEVPETRKWVEALLEVGG
jgi:sugar phosphate isomerase/epimerase